MKIIVMGSNFAGIDVALKLKKKKKDLEIAVIDNKKTTEFYPIMHELITSTEKIENIEINLEEDFRKDGITFINENITKVDPEKKIVATDKNTYGYDYLVNCLGSVPNFYGIEGAEKFSLTFKKVSDALQIKQKLSEIDPQKGSRIVIVGSGLTGIELTFQVKKRLDEYGKNPEITLTIVEAQNVICPFANVKTQMHIAKLLEKEGVIIKKGFMINKVTKETISSKEGDNIRYDILIWCAGITTNPVISASPIESDRSGMKIDENLRSTGNEYIFGSGDAISKLRDDGTPVPKTAHNAIIESKVLVKNILAAIDNKKPARFSIRKNSPLLIALGKYGAVLTYGSHIFSWPGSFFRWVKKMIERGWVSTRRI